MVDVEDTRVTSMGYPALGLLLRIGNLCNNAQSTEEMEHAVGQPTEVALLDLMTKFKLRDQRHIYRRVAETPFTFERKWMAVTCSHPDYPNDNVIFAKGALEAILDRCTSYAVSEMERRPMDAMIRQRIETAASNATAQGLRLISMAYGIDPEKLIFVGFAGMYDPPRPGVGDVVNRLVQNNVKVVMITGDSGWFLFASPIWTSFNLLSLIQRVPLWPLPRGWGSRIRRRLATTCLALIWTT